MDGGYAVVAIASAELVGRLRYGTMMKLAMMVTSVLATALVVRDVGDAVIGDGEQTVSATTDNATAFVATPPHHLRRHRYYGRGRHVRRFCHLLHQHRRC